MRRTSCPSPLFGSHSLVSISGSEAGGVGDLKEWMVGGGRCTLSRGGRKATVGTSIYCHGSGPAGTNMMCD